jgi:hypothetical protein
MLCPTKIKGFLTMRSCPTDMERGTYSSTSAYLWEVIDIGQETFAKIMYVDIIALAFCPVGIVSITVYPHILEARLSW